VLIARSLGELRRSRNQDATAAGRGRIIAEIWCRSCTPAAMLRCSSGNESRHHAERSEISRR